MSELAKKSATYEDLYKIPDNMIGEIIDGELIATPRPAPKHARATTVLSNIIGPSYDRFGEGGGPGGWIFLYEVEIKLGEHILVPDLAGWKQERFPTEIEHNWIPVAPDWICEFLSPATLRTDKIKKMPVYAQFGVAYAWLIDPRDKTLDIYSLESGRWSLLGSFVENDKVRAEPFLEIEINLADLWLESGLSRK
ncbi:MAG: Uma2 family endonuclease [Deltaproteobacteria bacterium]|jgi:Uma2 family endonuclease|nr:Uma2 family endonuclease [Deltaproteobacteria bacterium]MDA8307384.1 Uma2 family endonuclease [Deltaproteobacteria bacterium]